MGKQPDKGAVRRASRVRPVRVLDMRVPPAGNSQRVFQKSQAEKYAADFDVDKFGILVVNFRDGIYWVLDGQHRLAAYKIWIAPGDPGSVDCEVYENLTDAECADIFLGRDDRRRISTYEKFLVACTAERSRETDVRRIVEASGLKISRDKSDNCVGAVGALCKVYDAAGGSVLGQAVRTIRDAWGGDAESFDTLIIQALGMVFNRYNGRTNERELVKRLADVKQGVTQIIRKAETVRARTGNDKVQCIAHTIIEIYNKGSRHRLPAWWKTQEAA